MSSADPNRLFLKEERETFITILKGWYLPLGVMAVLSFLAVDFVLTPELLWTFLPLRLAVIPVALLCGSSYRLKFFSEKNYTWPAQAAGLYLGVLHAILISKTGWEHSPHFVGLMFATIPFVGQMAWQPRQIPGFFLWMYGPLGALMATRTSPDHAQLLVHAFFFLTTAVLSITFYVLSRRMRRSEFEHRHRLESTLRHQELVIDRKTEEGIFLERLASQFSPQIISSIKSGSLDLETRVRRPISCIFVDVQNSTARANRIDHHAYADLLASFFEECVRIFLRHNVTVGTYLGDGILAFTNAPTPDEKFQENALNACLEILAVHARKKKIYFDRWRTEFNIRLGIATGYSTVGFFPSREHGTYTALGETVNLAARLCSRAELNSIAVTKDFLTALKLPDQKIEIHELATIVDIKGFEGESFEVFGIKPPPARLTAEDQCPSCEISMERVSAQIGGSFWNCPKCNYRDFVTEQKTEPKKKLGLA